MAKLFTQGGASTNPNVTFISAADTTQAGSYDVNVTQAATAGELDRAERDVAHRRRLDDRGEHRHQPDHLRGQGRPTRQADVVSGLNAAFANAGLSLGASANGTGIEIDSVGYGHNATFNVAWDGTNFSAVAGTDVAGTINGVTATGNGQQLMVPFGTPGFGGLGAEHHRDDDSAISARSPTARASRSGSALR